VPYVEKLPFTGDDEADRLLVEEPLALLIGFELDQQVPLQKAFSGPLELKRRLGTLDAAAIASTDPERLDAIFRERPALQVLVLSMHPAAQFARRVLGAGASGYLTKDSAATELVDAIKQIRQGRMYLGSKVPEWTPAPAAGVAPHDTLSDREYQVLRMIGAGLTVSEIAATCGLSVKTVSTYRARLLEKLEMRSNAEVMRYAIENGLMDS